MTQEETSTRLSADDGFKTCALFMPRHSERRYEMQVLARRS
jgi:hypothetical protein